ncbi:HAMP domain-containing histidine kinase [Actinotalea sp. M2MS4P-6]|uniref:sensor histidine kinase n=1 Tax=Actinotalea sp. M2MS4P-6 TaxID=2983762 RepID=UPI0021E4266F|nr:HAMP domain-containing sensor histidine kinase [Actinotalea sp. M2MS4P-6]MCV2393074.1 HAMP domain-containing histidine kinase [Actinotalea sp. M2MS4P-6]
MRRLLVRYGLAMTSVVLVAFLVPLGLLARSLAFERALGVGRSDAQQVAVFAGDPGDEARLRATLAAVNTGERATTAFLPDGRVLGAPSERTDSVELAALGTALTARVAGGAEVLVPVGGSAGTTVIRTFVPESELTEGVARAWLLLAGVGAVLLAGTALAGHRIASRLSRSVRDLAGVAERLGAGDLEARVTPSGPPEVASVGAVLNELGDQVAGLLADERELVADLSHRLRTPITALSLDVDALDDPVDRERMAGHVEDLVVAVDSVIHQAREHDRRAPARCDAVRVVADRARFWAVLATAQGRALDLDVTDLDAPVALDEASLGAALDVLVDNVFRHTPHGTPFGLAVSREATEVVVTVHDRGPGLPDVRVVARGASGGGGTGLGLDVARRAAERAGGRLELSDAGPGLRIALVLPAV